MIKYAKVINKEKGLCQVGTGDPSSSFKVELNFLGLNKALEKIIYVSDFYKSLGMEELDVLQGIDGNWYLAGKAPSKPAPTKEEILKVYLDAVQAHLDATAQSRGYDNTYTCLSYLSSTDVVWRRESNAFNAWRDQVWRKCHALLNAVMTEEIKQPTILELIAQLPIIDWNDPVKVE